MPRALSDAEKLLRADLDWVRDVLQLAVWDAEWEDAPKTMTTLRRVSLGLVDFRRRWEEGLGKS